MRTERLIIADTGELVAEVAVAESFLSRAIGLLGRRGLDAGTGLLITRCSNIHMFFMRFPIDAVFIDVHCVIRKIAADLRPWRLAAARGAWAVVELPAGTAGRLGLQPGQRLSLG